NILARVSRVSGAIDPRSRTMLVEIWLDNREHQLYPGTYAKVTLHLVAAQLPRVPAAALAMREGKMVVGVVENNRLRLVEVETGLDDGKSVQIRRGLEPGAKVALNLPPELADGAVVQPLEQN